jgi:hypothetical protein
VFNRLKCTQTTSVSPQVGDYLSYASLLVSVLGGAILGGSGGLMAERHLQEMGNSDRATQDEINPQRVWVQEDSLSSSLDSIAFGTLFGMIGGYVLVGIPCQLMFLQLCDSQEDRS